jgi:hypothetical protein
MISVRRRFLIARLMAQLLQRIFARDIRLLSMSVGLGLVLMMKGIKNIRVTPIGLTALTAQRGLIVGRHRVK